MNIKDLADALLRATDDDRQKTPPHCRSTQNRISFYRAGSDSGHNKYKNK